MTCVRAISPKRVRITPAQSNVGDNGWRCDIKEAPAMPLDIERIERHPSSTDIVFRSAMTPGAAYLLTHPAAEYLFTGYRSPLLTNRRLDLVSLLPRYAQAMDDSGEQRDAMLCLQDVVDCLSLRIESLTNCIHLDRASPADVAGILNELGGSIDLAQSKADAARLIPALVELQRQKGTARGIKNAIRVCLALEVAEVRCRNHGANTKPADLYVFDLYFQRELSAVERERVHAVVEYMKPAHTRIGDILRTI